MIHARLFSPRTIAGYMLLYELITVAHPRARSLEESCAGCGANRCAEAPTLTVDLSPNGCMCEPRADPRLEWVYNCESGLGEVSAARLWGGSGYRVMTRHLIG
jgi:hypothetical protein